MIILKNWEKMMNISNERKQQLINFAEENLNNYDWFEYHNWDGHIECDETLTVEELEWMSNNFNVKVIVSEKNNV